MTEDKKAKARVRAKAWRLNNPERYKETKAAYYKKNKKMISARKASWAEKNKERLKRKMSAYYQAHKQTIVERSLLWAEANKEKMSENQKLWRKKTSLHRCEMASARRAGTPKATPKWGNEFFIREAYSLARLRTKTIGFKWHVDHIVPLKSKIVCGLHVENNLRVIPLKMNLAKGNRFWPDMP